MTIPIMLAEPPVIVQTAQTCWATAFESWAEANASLSGTPNTLSRHRLIELFEGDRRLTMASGRATTDGIMLMAGLGLMNLIPFNARRVSIELLARALDRGYVYLIYFRTGHPAHAVVLYGVDTQWIHVMDPMPGRGLVTLDPTYFATLRHGQVLLGFSMSLELSRGVSAALMPLMSDGR